VGRMIAERAARQQTWGSRGPARADTDHDVHAQDFHGCRETGQFPDLYPRWGDVFETTRIGVEEVVMRVGIGVVETFGRIDHDLAHQARFREEVQGVVHRSLGYTGGTRAELGEDLLSAQMLVAAKQQPRNLHALFSGRDAALFEHFQRLLARQQSHFFGTRAHESRV